VRLQAAFAYTGIACISGWDLEDIKLSSIKQQINDKYDSCKSKELISILYYLSKNHWLILFLS
jgi:hypothetical protein